MVIDFVHPAVIERFLHQLQTQCCLFGFGGKLAAAKVEGGEGNFGVLDIDAHFGA